MGAANCKTPLPCGSAREVPSTEAMPSERSDDYIEEVVCKESQLGENEMEQFDIGDDGKVLVVKQDGKIYALGAKCSHYGARLVNGALGKGRVRCPWHGACFSLATGDIEDFPGLDSIHSFQVTLEAGNVKVRAKKTHLVETKRIKPMVRHDPKNTQTMIIIGGGPSGAVCAETLRQEGFTGNLYVICREKVLPYDRVKLSKQLNFDLEKTLLRSAAFYDEYDIQMKLGMTADKLDCVNKTIMLSDGNTMKYDKLYIATGARATMLSMDGSNLENVMTLRDTEHARQALRMMMPTNEVVIFGGSFISMEIAAFSCAKVGKVTVVMRGTAPFKTVFGEDVGMRLMKFCQEHGVKFITKSTVTKCIGKKGVLTHVVVNDNTTLKADLFMMGLGAVPNTEFLADSGIVLNTDGTVVVDRYMKTSVEDVYAGGDIAYAPVYCNFNQPAAIGHFPLAHYHGKIAGLNMIGKDTPCKSVPFFWTMLFGKSLRYTGHGKYVSSQIEGSLEELTFVVYYFDEQERLISMMSLNKDPLVALYAEWLANGKHLYKHDLQPDPLAWSRKKI